MLKVTKVAKAEVENNVNTWLEALESGKLAQTTGTLEDATGFCCLGVACNVLGEKRSVSQKKPGKYAYGDEDETDVLTDNVRIKLGLTNSNPSIVGRYIKLKDGVVGRVQHSELAELNDDWGLDFNQIADLIRSQPTGLFIYKDLKLNPKTNGVPSSLATKEEFDQWGIDNEESNTDLDALK